MTSRRICFPSGPRAILFLSNNCHTLSAVARHITKKPTASGNNLRTIRESSSSTINCQLYPTILQDTASLGQLNTLHQSTDLTVVFLEMADMHPNNLERIVHSVEACRPFAKPVCFLFSRSISSVSLRSTCYEFANKFHEAYFAINLHWEERVMPPVIDSLRDNYDDLDIVDGLRHFNYEFGTHPLPKQYEINRHGEKVEIPVFDYHPSYLNAQAPRPTKERPRETSINPHRLQQTQRDKAVIVLRKVMMECNEDGDPHQLEQQIYDESGGDTQEYVAILCHERIRMRSQCEQPLTKAEVLLGKRKRNTLEPRLDRDRVKAVVPVRWTFLQKTEAKYILPKPGDESTLHIPLKDEVSRELERRYRDPRARTETFTLQLLEDQPPCEINLDEMSVTRIGDTPGSNTWQKLSLNRELVTVASESPLDDLPEHWVPQDTVFFREELDPQHSFFEQIVNEMRKTLPDVQIHKITRLQHLNQWWSFMYKRNLLEVTHWGKDLVEKLLFHGSWTMSPDLLQKDGLSVHVPDPDPNDNWGKAIHLSDAAWYAHERASHYHDEQNQVHYQIFFVHTMVGLPVSLPSDPTLRHAPKQTEVNNMKVYYDSVQGQYTKGDRTADVWAVYNPDQTCPQFLIDYTLPSTSTSSGSK